MSVNSLSDESTGFVSEIRSISELFGEFSDNYEAKSKTGFQFGGFATIDLGPSFSIQPEILYSKRGAKIEGTATIPIPNTGDSTVYYPIDEKVELSYLEIPVLVKYRLPLKGNLKPSLFAGPALVFNLSGTDDFYMKAVLDSAGTVVDSAIADHETDISNIKSTSFNFVIGGDLKIEAGSANFILDVRYTIGTSNVFEDVNPSVFEDINLMDDLPSDFPIADWETGKAPDMKNRVLSITAGVSIPL